MDKKLHICHVSDCLPGTHKFWGGAEQACQRLIEASVRNNMDVSVITTRPDIDAAPQGINFYTASTLDSFISPDLIKNLSLRHLGIDPISFVPIYRHLKKIKPDLVHIHRTVFLTLSAVKAAGMLRIPVVATVYDYFNFCPKETLVDISGSRCGHPDAADCVSCMGFSGAKAFFKRPFVNKRKKIFDRLLKRVCFHVLSQSSYEILRDYGIEEGRIRKVLQVFPLQGYGKPETIRKGTILFIGWMQERKGLHILLEAMPRILEKFPDAHLTAVGAVNSDAYFDRIKKLIEDKNLSRHVDIIGKKEYPEVSELMKKANVVVVPEQWENMSPVVLIEAMFSAKPVVASKIGGIPEFIIDKENGLLAEPSSPYDFAEKIIMLLGNEGEAERLGEKAHNHINSIMNEDKIISDYKSLYRERIENRNT